MCRAAHPAHTAIRQSGQRDLRNLLQPPSAAAIIASSWGMRNRFTHAVKYLMLEIGPLTLGLDTSRVPSHRSLSVSTPVPDDSAAQITNLLESYPCTFYASNSFGWILLTRNRGGRVQPAPTRVPRASDPLASPPTVNRLHRPSQAKSRIMCSCRIRSGNSFVLRTYKIIKLKPRLESTLAQNTGGGEGAPTP